MCAMVELSQPSALPKPQLLVVDDLEDSRAILKRRFERHGFAVRQAVDGRDALEQIAAGSVDVVLLDIGMPDLDGFEVLSRIREAHDDRALPVIMVTVRDASDDMTRARRLGANDYIAKPVDFATVLSSVRSALERRTDRRPAV